MTDRKLACVAIRLRGVLFHNKGAGNGEITCPWRITELGQNQMAWTKAELQRTRDAGRNPIALTGN
jgi:hypothetical protein